MARLENNKWFVENINGNNEIKIEGKPNQGLFICKVKQSVVTICGKINTIVVDNTEATGVIFDDVISTVEVINSKKIQLQANGAVPAISVDKTAGATIYLQTAASQSASIVTSLSSEVNVTIPGKTDDDDPTELAVPQQFVSKLVNGKLVTTPSEHV
eukprot:TRINITY_DN121_c0_g2_i4.p1 TRINITY_DN121_c0_g2~~TRINITY_DN121_c0_g2_i4.p1  ORF type:complete len:173 (+),score=44.82 TRINITY_DN121_c0_g2_i4:50-520(+)